MPRSLRSLLRLAIFTLLLSLLLLDSAPSSICAASSSCAELDELVSALSRASNFLTQTRRATERLRTEVDELRSHSLTALQGTVLEKLLPLSRESLISRTPTLIATLLGKHLPLRASPPKPASKDPLLVEHVASPPLGETPPPEEGTAHTTMSASDSDRSSPVPASSSSRKPTTPPAAAPLPTCSESNSGTDNRITKQNHTPSTASQYLPQLQLPHDVYLRTVCTVVLLLGGLIVLSESHYSPPALLMIPGGLLWIYWLLEYPLRGLWVFSAQRSLLWWIAAGVVSQQGVLLLMDTLMRYGNVHSKEMRRVHSYLMKALEVYTLLQEMASVQLGLCCLEASLLTSSSSPLQVIVHAASYVTPLSQLSEFLTLEIPQFVAFQMGKRAVYLLDFVRYLTASAAWRIPAAWKRAFVEVAYLVMIIDDPLYWTPVSMLFIAWESTDVLVSLMRVTGFPGNLLNLVYPLALRRLFSYHLQLRSIVRLAVVVRFYFHVEMFVYLLINDPWSSHQAFYWLQITLMAMWAPEAYSELSSYLISMLPMPMRRWLRQLRTRITRKLPFLF
mmetsp:Transcript_13851/g.35347  ORF Transcript_13851/g.35347 Transcript_13851/m.35347 type:complete len:560 (+) Transcript_13851:51-1730(+)